MMVETILQAAARVFVRDGFDATTNGIAQAAGVSVGSLYQYFPSKDAIAVELLRRYRETLVEQISKGLAAVENESLESVVRRLLTDLLRAERIDPVLHRVLIEQVVRTSARKEVTGFEARFEADLEAALRRMGDRVKVPDYGVASFILVRVVLSVVQSTVVERPKADRPKIVEELVRLVTTYVGERTPAVG